LWHRLKVRNATAPDTLPRGGTQSIAGKPMSSQNALKHGLLAKNPVLPDESQGDYDAFRASIIVQLAPQGAYEEFLARRVADCAWRLQRVGALEACVINQRRDVVEPDPEHPFELPPAMRRRYTTLGQAIIDDAAGADALSKLSRYEASVEGAMLRSKHELEREQARRRCGSVAERAST
jgi:hypothetical protein